MDEFQNHYAQILDDSNNLSFGFNYIDDQNVFLPTFLETSPLSITSSSSFDNFSLPYENPSHPQTLDCFSLGQHFTNPFVDHDLIMSPSLIKLKSTPLDDQDYHSLFSMFDDDHVQNCQFVHDHHDAGYNEFNPEILYTQGVFGELDSPETPKMPVSYKGKKGKNGKVEGQQSKNLMAERRRRKRLNDRLSMLRSIVPKISKTDRTSILADTIDYMKELLHKINHIQQQQINTSSNFTTPCTATHGIFMRNSPKFEVERRKEGRETVVEIEVYCSGKPELLISTISTLEELGLQIQQCVISCFNDFTMHASCSDHHGKEQGINLSADDIKQALFRNAGYSGRCL